MRETPPTPALASRFAWLAFAAALAIPSIGAVVKYTHLRGLAVYLALVLLAAWAIQRGVYPWFMRRMPERATYWLAALTFLAMLALFAVIYPLANAGVVGGGTDRDDALNIAVTALWHGRYPYSLKTYIGAAISPLPGSLLLAAPFVLLGNSAYQDLFWPVAFYVVTQRYLLRSGRSTLLFSWAILLLSPLFWQELVTGGDLLANALFVYVFVVLAVAWTAPARPAWQGRLAALLLGIGLASRINYILALAPVTVALARSLGRPLALRRAALTLLTMAALIVPFYVYDPAGFSPLRTARLIGQLDTFLPGVAPVLVGLMILAALWLAFRQYRRAAPELPRSPASGGSPSSGGSAAEGAPGLRPVLAAAALPQAIPIVAGLLLFVLAGRLDNTFSVFMGYGFSFMFAGAAAAWRSVDYQPQFDTAS